MNTVLIINCWDLELGVNIEKDPVGKQDKSCIMLWAPNPIAV